MTDVDKIVAVYDEYLRLEGIDQPDFDICDDLVFTVYFKYVYPKYEVLLDRTAREKKKYEKYMAKQLNYTRLSLLRVKYFRNGNNSSGIKEGYVYILVNRAWKTHFKIGSSIDIKKRLNSYQTYSPHRDFEILESYFTHDRFAEERAYHIALNADHEWIETVYTDGRSSCVAITKHFNSKRMSDYHNSVAKIREYMHL